jgi:hypothetical protein
MHAPLPSFDHLVRLTDDVGIFEHADGTVPRTEHGYCTDDNARLLVVACRESMPSPVVRSLARKALRFVAAARSVDGRCRNRMSPARRWQDRPGVEDCWGRSLWGLGSAAARDPSTAVRQEALARFEHGARRRSAWPRSMAFAGLGAAEVLDVQPSHHAARALLSDAAALADGGDHDASWRWPEPRPRYANAMLAEVTIAAGAALRSDDLTRRGLEMLGWLLDQETGQGHLSVTPAGGRSPGDPRPAFDQQPIEVAALADACARAAVLTGDTRWAQGVADSVAWFAGANDSRAVMWDASSGGGFDGLTPSGPNTNQGAESTLALVSTLQHARHLQMVDA